MVGYMGLRIFLFTIISFLSISITNAYDYNWYGNKYNNLVTLTDVLKDMPNVQVPQFMGISNGRIQDFLKKHAPEVFNKYDFIVRYINAQQYSKLKFAYLYMINVLNSQSINSILSDIQNIIESVFTKNDFEFTYEEINFFHQMAAKNHFFMVRSTGVEDSQTVANAGGNISCAYIEPQVSSIQMALGKVVASYFGMQSLKNRIGNGGQLTNELCLPVLIQELVGEVPGGASNDEEIPVSGVAFTTNQTLSSESMKITEINASYGHGEGVVANKVLTDKYYMVPSKISDDILIYPTLSYKPERLVASSRFDLVLVQNSNNLAYKSSLSNDQLQKLYQILQKIEQAYQRPMDVEFVIHRSTVYVVQARPAMHYQLNPSFVSLDMVTDEYIESSLQGFSLVPGQAQVLVISNPNDIIITKTLDEADQMPNSTTAKAVLVGSWASSLSHAAVNFMSHGTPCLYFQNFNELVVLKSKISKSQQLIIDVQQHMVFLSKKQSNIHQFIKSGWYECPINESLSISLDRLPSIRLHQNPLPRDAYLISLIQALKTASDKEQKIKLLDQIVQRVNQFFILTEHRISYLKQYIDEALKNVFTKYKTFFQQHVKQMRACISQNGQSIEFLLYHKILEALLLQQVEERGTIINGYNYSYFLNELYSVQELCMLFHKLKISGSPMSNSLLMASQFAPKELSIKWNEWVLIWKKLAESNQEVEEEFSLIDSLFKNFERLEVLPIWFASEFYQSVQYVKNAEVEHNEIKRLNGERPLDVQSQKEWSATNGLTLLIKPYKDKIAVMQFLDDLKCYKNVLASIKAQKNSEFASLSEAQIIWEKICNNIIQPMTNEEFIKLYEQSPFTIKLIVCDLMRECIDTIDGTIKALKASMLISWQDRAVEFKKMLKEFKKIYRLWSTNIMPYNAMAYHSRWNLYAYNARIEELFEEIIIQGEVSQNMFQRSNSFSVNAAMLGSNTEFERHYPKTAEDMFMLIHQNSLIVVAATYNSLLNGKELSEQLYLPAHAKDFLAYFESLLSRQKKISPIRIGIEYNTEILKLFYNIPLRNHSATFQLIYNSITDQWNIAVQFLGQARARWKQIKILTCLSSELSHLELIDDVVLDRRSGIVSWQWVIKNKDQLSTVFQYLSIMHDLSFESYLGLNYLIDIQADKAILKQALTQYLQKYKTDRLWVYLTKCRLYFNK